MHLVRQGHSAGSVFIIENGWTVSSHSLPGGTRQILDVQIPGDLAGLNSLHLQNAGYDVVAITAVEAFEVKAGAVLEPLAADPELAAALFWLASHENAVAAERLVDLGRRTALERTAHFILELAMRLNLAGLGTASGFPCPLTQYHIADALGLTAVHVNRVLRELRISRLAHHRRGWISVLNAGKLGEVAKFDGRYLDSTRPAA